MAIFISQAYARDTGELSLRNRSEGLKRGSELLGLTFLCSAVVPVYSVNCPAGGGRAHTLFSKFDIIKARFQW